MASGYEKHACGVNPNEGWGKPTRRDRWISGLYLGAALTLVFGMLASAIWRGFFAG